MRMRLYKYIPVVLLGIAGFVGGCSTTTEPPVTSADSTTVSFAAQSKMTFYEQRLDTANGDYGQDQPDPTSTDSVHSTVVDTNASIYGKTHVVVIYNARTRNLSDTTYLWQDGQGNIYEYNYGVDILNNLDGLVAYLGHKLSVGWVLQAKLNSAATTGTTWVAARDTEHVTIPQFPIPIEVDIADNATKLADTTVMVGANSVNAVHTRHVVTANSALGVLATVNIDNYMSRKYGTVTNVAHSFMVGAPFNQWVSGHLRVMAQHQ